MTSISTDQMIRAPLEPIVRPLTVADLAAMPDELPSGSIKYELDNGRLIMTPPPGSSHGLAQVFIAAALQNHVKKHDLGLVWVETGVILWRNPDRCVGPEVSFVAREKLPVRLSPEGYLETIPTLVVEVRSKNDTTAYLERKLADYLKAGVQVAWMVDPVAKTLVEHRPDKLPTSSGPSETLQCDDILPGFRLSLGELFKEL